jgi:hypothetical protein
VTPAQVRDTLAGAANTVDGLDVAPRWRQLAASGQGAVRRALLARADNGFGWVSTWQVWVMVPADLGVAEEWVDVRVMDLIEALSPHMVVASVTPQQLNQGGTTVPCVVIEGHREQE